MSEKETPYWTFVAARDSGNEEEAIRLAWDAVSDREQFCDGQAVYLRGLTAEYGDIEALERLRNEIQGRVKAGQVGRLEQELVRIDAAIRFAGKVNEVCEAVKQSPGISRAELWQRFDVFRDKRQHAKAVADGLEPDRPWITGQKFDQYLASPLLEVKGKGREASVWSSGRAKPNLLKTAVAGCLVTLSLVAALVSVAVL